MFERLAFGLSQGPQAVLVAALAVFSCYPIAGGFHLTGAGGLLR